jgi:hypothetical protein
MDRRINRMLREASGDPRELRYVFELMDDLDLFVQKNDADLPPDVLAAIANEIERREDERIDWDRPDVRAAMRVLAPLSNESLVERAHAVK